MSNIVQLFSFIRFGDSFLPSCRKLTGVSGHFLSSLNVNFTLRISNAILNTSLWLTVVTLLSKTHLYDSSMQRVFLCFVHYFNQTSGCIKVGWWYELCICILSGSCLSICHIPQIGMASSRSLVGSQLCIEHIRKYLKHVTSSARRLRKGQTISKWA